jgi:hypothetical protein
MKEQAHELFEEIVDSNTEIYCIADILSDFSKQKV